MTRKVDPARRVVPIEQWPMADREAWIRGTTAVRSTKLSEHILGPAGPKKSKATIAKYAEGWGRYLGWLEYTSQLDVLSEPASRVSDARMFEFVDHLERMGNAPYTIFGRVQEMAGALRIMGCDDAACSVLRPGGACLFAYLQPESRELEVHHPGVLYRWGFALMKEGLHTSGPRRRQVLVRDGLLIALLAARAFRQRTAVAMRVDINLYRADDGWWMRFDQSDMKNSRKLEYRAPKGLTPWIERYLSHERLELLDGRSSDALWINWGGDPLKPQGVEKRIRWRSAKKFGVERAFGTHRMRYGVATFGAQADPDNALIGARVLGITARVAEIYQRGADWTASRRFQSTVEEEQERTEPVAALLFKRRDFSG